MWLSVDEGLHGKGPEWLRAEWRSLSPDIHISYFLHSSLTQTSCQQELFACLYCLSASLQTASHVGTGLATTSIQCIHGSPAEASWRHWLYSNFFNVLDSCDEQVMLCVP